MDRGSGGEDEWQDCDGQCGDEDAGSLSGTGHGADHLFVSFLVSLTSLRAFLSSITPYEAIWGGVVPTCGD
jgi:hypothetical protein